MKASASKTALLLSCRHWAREDVALPVEKTSPAAKRGTDVHALVADYVNRGRHPSFDVNDWIFRRAVQGIKIASAQAGMKPEAEVCFAMGEVSGTDRLGVVADRSAYPADKFCGTADVLLAYEDGTVGIRDWKTGSPSDAEEWQLRALAAMATEAGLTVRDAKAVYLTDTAPRYSENYLDDTDQTDDAATIRKHLALIPGSEPTPGYWCKSLWCPARTVCKAVV